MAGRTLVAALASLGLAASAAGQERLLEVHYTPTARAQIAIWIERADGTFVDTVRLTQATAVRGIGNRPGAMLMNGGFRWPYGRRETVLPVWAHRRAASPGALPFPRVIFQDRTSEGFASRTSQDFSRDDYFCLSFDAATTRREALDAVSCASVFNSDKGRYLTEEDVAAGYAEPFEEPDGRSYMRPLSLRSLYPPRRDVTRCDAVGCADHRDVAAFAADARRVMPGLDAVTMATPRGDLPQRVQLDVPAAWPDGDYAVWIEVGVEGDTNERFDERTYGTPSGPPGGWDYWAQGYGYPYRGQPSVVYTVPFRLGVAGSYATDAPGGYGAMDGRTGDLAPMGPMITDDPVGAPGSGADRLRRQADGSRLRVVVISTNVCLSEDPPPECGTECDEARPCPTGFVCGPARTCLGYCDFDMPPPAVTGFVVGEHPDERRSHEWATLAFDVPPHTREIAAYDVRVSTAPITDEASFRAALPANAASLDSVQLVVPTGDPAGTRVRVELGGLTPELRYFIGIRPIDGCNDAGPIAVAEVTTTRIRFTTVSPCFVATAAYGSPLADEIGPLRRLRDRHLRTSPPGRALVAVYEALGPHAASVLRRSEALRAAARVSLRPWVTLARLVEPDA